MFSQFWEIWSASSSVFFIYHNVVNLFAQQLHDNNHNNHLHLPCRCPAISVLLSLTKVSSSSALRSANPFVSSRMESVFDVVDNEWARCTDSRHTTSTNTARVLMENIFTLFKIDWLTAVHLPIVSDNWSRAEHIRTSYIGSHGARGANSRGAKNADECPATVRIVRRT